MCLFPTYNELCVYYDYGQRGELTGVKERAARKLKARVLYLGMTSRGGREVVNMMERQRVNIQCVQEIRWEE